MRFLPDRFVMLMVGCVILALIFPQWGASDGPLRLGLVTQIGIALVFFLHGANLSPENLATGVRNWRVHGLIQGTTFVLFPAAGLVLYVALAPVMDDGLRLGFFFLAALPSTISSSIALTALGRGNVPAAVFNATLSGLLGLFLTPLMISLVSAAGAAEFSLVEAIIDIVITLLVPFALGQALRPFIKTFLAANKSVLSLFDRGVILLIIFTSFATSTANNVWAQFSIAEFAITIALVLVLLTLALGATMFAARRIGLSREDEVAAVFCGSTKSLANGAPIAQILFAGSPALGLIMLPLMLYHQAQLMVCAVFAQRYSNRAPAKA